MNNIIQCEEFPWESKYQYTCRVDKIREYTGKLGVLRATALANVWANHHFLGCSYSALVLDDISSWGAPPKDKMYEETLAKVRELEKEAEYDKSLVNPDLDVKLLDMRLCESLGDVKNTAIGVLCNSAQKFKKSIEFIECAFDKKSGQRTVSLKLNDNHISDGFGQSFKEAKHACAENSIKYLKKLGILTFNPNIVDDSLVGKVSKDSLVGNVQAQKIEEDNIGNKLLKAMGWTGDTGLGKSGQGIKDPISSKGQINRGGLGSSNSEYGICRQNVQEQLLVFLRNPDLQKLEFGSELDNIERKLIHNLSDKYGLKHKSRGKGANRFLTVWKEPTVGADVTFETLPDYGDEHDPLMETDTSPGHNGDSALQPSARKFNNKQKQPHTNKTKSCNVPQRQPANTQQTTSQNSIPDENTQQITLDSLTKVLPQNFDLTRIDENNVGNRLLKSMGWKEGTGLGKRNQGRVDPVSIEDGQSTRRGFGSNSKSLIKQIEETKHKATKKNQIWHGNIQQQLHSFLENSEVMKLEFPSEFNVKERRLVKSAVEEFNMRYAANLNTHVVKVVGGKGKKGKKKVYTLVVWKSTSAQFSTTNSREPDDSSDDELSDSCSSGKWKQDRENSPDQTSKEAIPFNYKAQYEQYYCRASGSLNNTSQDSVSVCRNAASQKRHQNNTNATSNQRPSPHQHNTNHQPNQRYPHQNSSRTNTSGYDRLRDPYLTNPGTFRGRAGFHNQRRIDPHISDFFVEDRTHRQNDPRVSYRNDLRDQFNNYIPPNDRRNIPQNIGYDNTNRQNIGYDGSESRDPRLAYRRQPGFRTNYHRPGYR